MKYDTRLLCRYQSGCGDVSSTLWREIHEIGKYWIVTDTGACGASIHVFLKSEVESQEKEILIDFKYPKVSKSTSGWWLVYEDWEEAVARNINAFENASQLLWFEKCQRKNLNESHPDFGKLYDSEQLKFSSDVSEENKKKIESTPLFKNWTNKYGSI